MSTSPIVPRSPSEVPSDNNPSVDQNLLRSRTYRHTLIRVRAEGGTDFPKMPKFSQKMLQGGQFAIVPTLFPNSNKKKYLSRLGDFSRYPKREESLQWL